MVAFEVGKLVWVRLAGYVLIIGKQNMRTEFLCGNFLISPPPKKDEGIILKRLFEEAGCEGLDCIELP